MTIRPGMYLGIDLGTTNTLVAHVTVDPLGKFTEPHCLKIAQQVDEYGHREQRESLSSAVYLASEDKSIVGAYAYDRIMHGDRSNVIAWWKNYIGRPNTDKRWGIHGRLWRPVEAAAAVLRHVREQLEIQFPNALTKPVVTVPASFPESMKAATREAIRLAGWVDEGEEPLLLYEPLAALIAYLEQYERQQMILPPEQRAPDWEKGGRVIVYDIGGGTIDVTLVRLEPCRDPVTNEPRLRGYVEGYAPHTLLGGFKFDEQLSEVLLRRFQQECGFADGLPKQAYNFLFYKLLSWAETVKMTLANGQLEVKRNIALPPDLNLGHSWQWQVTLAEYEQAISPLLGHEATIDTPLPALEWQHIGEAAHIVEPIIRLMRDQKLHPTDISAVLLVGGMSYVPAIRRRLKEFFGPQTHLLWQQPDPLKAIAYGAALHNAQVSNGRSVHNILLRPGALRAFDAVQKRAVWLPLIPSETSLTYGKKFKKTIENLTFRAHQREVKLKVHYGNVVLRGIRFQLPEDVPSDEQIPFTCTAEVDSDNHILVIRASLQDQPDVGVQAIFDETPDRTPDFRAEQSDIQFPDPEANRLSQNIPSLLHMLNYTKNSQEAAGIRKRLEQARKVGAYIKEITQLFQTANYSAQEHTSLLIARVFQRYTYQDALNPRTSTEIGKILQVQQPYLITLLEKSVSSKALHSQLRAQAAYALGFVGLWSPQKVNTELLLNLVESAKTPTNVRIETARAIGRTLPQPTHWHRLLRFWQTGLPAGVREAILWAIGRSVTRNPELIIQAQTSVLISFLKKVLAKGIRDPQHNAAVETVAWQTIALLNITRDIERKFPIYYHRSSALVTQVRNKALEEKNRRVPGRTECVQAAVSKSAERALMALAGEVILSDMLQEMEHDLPVLIKKG